VTLEPRFTRFATVFRLPPSGQRNDDDVVARRLLTNPAARVLYECCFVSNKPLNKTRGRPDNKALNEVDAARGAEDGYRRSANGGFEVTSEASTERLRPAYSVEKLPELQVVGWV